MKKKILVIDDEQAVRKAFALALEDEDCVVAGAASGKEGLAIFGQGGVDLVFLDLRMPEMSGVEVLREMRRADKETVIYIVTAFHEEFFEELKSAAEGGIHFELVEKPVASDQIVMIFKSLQGDISCG